MANQFRPHGRPSRLSRCSVDLHLKRAGRSEVGGLDVWPRQHDNTEANDRGCRPEEGRAGIARKPRPENDGHRPGDIEVERYSDRTIPSIKSRKVPGTRSERPNPLNLRLSKKSTRAMKTASSK
jgi:hypothetical protein